MTDGLAESNEDAGPEIFGPASLLWEHMGDVRMLAVFPGALIMQVMYPAVGSAVGEFSVYRTDPWGRAVRSLHSVLVWVYGGSASIDEGRRLRKLHGSISGVDTDGRRYHALNPELYGWVHATGYERTVTLCRLFGNVLNDEQQDQLYEEFVQLGVLLGIRREHMPPDRQSYWRYFEGVVAQQLVNHPTAQDVLLRMKTQLPAPPRWPRLLRGLWRPVGRVFGPLNYFFTVGTLPPAVRSILGVRWTANNERALRLVASLLRLVVPKLPNRVRYLPYAYDAMRRC